MYRTPQNIKEQNGDEGGNRTPYYAIPSWFRANGNAWVVAMRSSAKSQRHKMRGGT